MIDWFISGTAIGLAILLAAAGVSKLRSLAAFEAVLVQLLPKRFWRLVSSRSAARLIVSAEIVTALALIAPHHALFLAGAASATGLSFCFLASILLANRKQMPCGCFGSADRVAGPSDIVRGALLLAISIALAVLGSVSGFGHALGTAGLGAAAVAFAVVLIAVLPWIGARVDEPSSDGSAGRHSAPGEAGVSRKTFLARSLAAGLALTAAAAFGFDKAAQANPPRPPRSCEAQFDLCYGCTTKTTWENDVACCSFCYAQCQLGPPCIPGVHCGGCWPGP